jgi:hypothetical protein
MAEFTLPKNSKIVRGRTWKPQKGERLRTFEVYRYEPDTGVDPRWDHYTVDLDKCGPSNVEMSAPESKLGIATITSVSSRCFHWTPLIVHSFAFAPRAFCDGATTGISRPGLHTNLAVDPGRSHCCWI